MDSSVPETTDHFQKLEEKMLKAIELFKRTQAEKHALEKDVEKLASESKERARQIETLEKELIALRREREDVRERIEKLVDRLDHLTSQDSEG